jgi:hypothetical protein
MGSNRCDPMSLTPAGTKCAKPAQIIWQVRRQGCGTPAQDRPELAALPSMLQKAGLWTRPFAAIHAGGEDHPFASGNATNRIASAVFTCSRTLCLPSALACVSADRTSPAFATALPPTSKMMSPFWMPCFRISRSMPAANQYNDETTASRPAAQLARCLGGLSRNEHNKSVSAFERCGRACRCVCRYARQRKREGSEKALPRWS